VQGLYKVEFQTVHGSGRGVLYAHAGKLFGGNSAFAFTGSYDENGDEIAIEISRQRHDDEPSDRPLCGCDSITLALTGRRRGDRIDLEGSAPQAPGIVFRSTMTPISDEGSASPAGGRPNGITNGLYSINIRMLDGVDGGNTGVMVLHDGLIRGGDAYFGYIGSYTSANGRWKGEIINIEHTPTRGERPVFGGYEVGIGFSGSYNDAGADGEATALVGKRSIRFKAVLKLLVAA
jgi:hypothetical protein